MQTNQCISLIEIIKNYLCKNFVKMKLYSLDVNKISRRECFTNSLRNFYCQIQKKGCVNVFENIALENQNKLYIFREIVKKL